MIPSCVKWAVVEKRTMHWKNFCQKARELSVHCVTCYVTAQGSESNSDWKLFLSRAYVEVVFEWRAENLGVGALWPGRPAEDVFSCTQVKTLRSRPRCQWDWCECVCVLKFHISRVTLRCTPLFTFEKVTVEKKSINSLAARCCGFLFPIVSSRSYQECSLHSLGWKKGATRCGIN
jgi:hypothetical protein